MTDSKRTIIRVTHPGSDDPVYLARRQEIEKITSSYQKDSLIPLVKYREEEEKTWSIIAKKMVGLHKGRVCTRYMKGKDALKLPLQRIPQLQDLDERLKKLRGFRVVPVEGWADSRSFFERLSERKMFCTQYIRHASQPEYTPEPDIVHEVIGHLPMFALDDDFTAFTQLIGWAGAVASPEEMIQLERLYWFTSEFGLIKEKEGVRIYGASPAGSVGEIQNCLTDKVERKPFQLEEVLDTNYDIYGFQKKFFVIDSFKQLFEETEPYLRSIIDKKRGLPV